MDFDPSWGFVALLFLIAAVLIGWSLMRMAWDKRDLGVPVRRLREVPNLSLRNSPDNFYENCPCAICESARQANRRESPTC